jgi:(p)ppGpp synthase/HD superfamily hydrolase
MKYTKRTEKALQTAATLHDGQYRKGDRKLPYISHPISVMLILSKYSNDEDLYISALMHDTVEDTDYTPAKLELDFGEKVKEIVTGVTEPREKNGKQLSLVEGKKAYIETLRAASDASLMVAAADKVHNLRSITNSYENDLERYWRDFNGTKESKLVYYEEITEIIVSRLNNPMVEELKAAYEDFKKFLNS